jgi:hypothetical protein
MEEKALMQKDDKTIRKVNQLIQQKKKTMTDSMDKTW